MRKEAEAWIKIAGEELQSAEYLAEKKLFRMVCYHSQQSVEKILKSLLVEHDIDIPRTHNILDLNNAARKLGYETRLDDEEAVFLNSIYMHGILPTWGLCRQENRQRKMRKRHCR